MQDKIEKFITDNGLQFVEGTRNSDSTILSGYALHLGIKEVEILTKAIDNVLPDADDYYSELDRVFKYAQKNNYGKYWKTKVAKETYVF